jgi:hypothetical protein
LIEQEGVMSRERVLKIVLVLVGLLFTAGIYPLTMTLWQRNPSLNADSADAMMLSLYFTLGIFLLLAARNPSAHRSLIAFAAWSSLAHGAVMAVMAIQIPSERAGLLIGVAALVIRSRCVGSHEKKRLEAGLGFELGDEIYFNNRPHNNLRVTFGPILRF